MAVIVAAALAWCFALTWDRAIREAIENLPSQGLIRNGRLEWSDTEIVRLTENRFLTILVAPAGGANPGQVADLQLEFGPTEWKLRSLFGYLGWPYPEGWTLALNRSEMKPWWGAWRPVVFAGIMAGVFACLFAVWWALALVYAGPARILAALAGRRVTLWGCWKLSGAALLPGALVFTAVLLLYAVHRVNLPTALGFCLLHLAVGWAYVAIAPARLPQQSIAAGPPPAPDPAGDPPSPKSD